MKLIDKDALVVEIEGKINEINLDNIEDWRYRLQREHDIEVMKNILSILDTLEVKEVDLELVSPCENCEGDGLTGTCASISELGRCPLKYRKQEPVNEDLGEYINKLSKQFPEMSFAKLSRIAVRVAKWQKQQMMKDAIEAEYWDCSLILDGGMRDMFEDGDKVKLIIIKEE